MSPAQRQLECTETAAEGQFPKAPILPVASCQIRLDSVGSHYCSLAAGGGGGGVPNIARVSLLSFSKNAKQVLHKWLL